MLVSEVIDALNNQKKKKEEVANILGVSKDYVGKRLNNLGYKWNRSNPTGFYFQGEGSEPVSEKFVEDSHKNQKKVRQVSENKDENKEIISENNQNNFSKEDIEFIKSAISSQKKIGTREELFQNYGKMPKVKSLKDDRDKISIFLTKETNQKFNDFSQNVVGASPSKMELIEIALIEFMEKYKKMK